MGHPRQLSGARCPTVEDRHIAPKDFRYLQRCPISNKTSAHSPIREAASDGPTSFNSTIDELQEVFSTVFSTDASNGSGEYRQSSVSERRDLDYREPRTLEAASLRL